VYRAQASGSSKSDYTQIADITSSQYQDTSVEDGEQYFYRVTSYTEDPAFFEVTISSTNSPVQPGTTLDVTADVTNTGNNSAQQTVTLDINNGVGQADSVLLELAGGSSTTQTLSWAVPSGQTEQNYQATVSSDDDSASQTVTVDTGPSLVAQQDLVAWYPMENGDARDAANTTDFGDATAYDGTVNGATHEPSGGVTDVSAGPSSGAFNFNDGSSSDRIDIGNIPSIEDVSQVTVCAWLNETNSNSSDKEAVGDYTNSFNDAVAMSANRNGSLVYRVRKSGNRLNTTTSISRDGSYAHFAFVFDNGSIQGYKNGSPTGSDSGGPSTTPSVQMNLGGRFSSGNDYIGDIDDVRFYATALTDSEINQIYTNTQP
jgi:hypothetical protein